MEQTEEKKVIGHKEQVYMLDPSQIKVGEYYMNNLLPNGKVVLITKKNANSVRFRVWNEYKSRMVEATAGFDGFYRIVQVPVYEQ